MLDFQIIKDQYPVVLQRYERAILREYLQVKTLQAIFESKTANQVTFIGGTALRILYANQRFSEDIDLDNYNLSWDDFGELVEKVKRFLTNEGFIVEIHAIAKGAYHCDIRFPELLFEQGLTPHLGQKLLIRVDTVAQGYKYQPQIRILNQFDVFTEIRVAPLPVLLSQKIFALVNRKRPKGRDFYDVTFLSGMTKPDFGFLKQKMGVDSPEKLRRLVLDRLAGIDLDLLAIDVEPFLLDKTQVKRVRLFRTFWEQVDLG
jgi:predicted nucleotidyltransferase component of viral defense system